MGEYYIYLLQYHFDRTYRAKWMWVKNVSEIIFQNNKSKYSLKKENKCSKTMMEYFVTEQHDK
jgi:hypothetical protein